VAHKGALESVHPDEVGKTGTRSSTRQDGGDVDNSDSGDVNDMDVSFDCELNLSTSGKKPCRRSMMLSSRIRHGC
jgi:hypothetical protein